MATIVKPTFSAPGTPTRATASAASRAPPTAWEIAADTHGIAARESGPVRSAAAIERIRSK